MTNYTDLPQEVKDTVTEEQWNALLENGVTLDS